MKGKKFLALMATAALSLSVLSGCLGNLNNAKTNDGIEYDEDSEDDSQSEGKTQLVALGEAGVDDGTIEFEGGLDPGEMTGEPDENPKRSVRRSTNPINQTVNTMLDGTPLPEDFYMYRSILTPQYQQAYDQICKGLMDHEESIEMNVAVPQEDIFYVYFCVYYDHPELFWVNSHARSKYNGKNIVTEVIPEYYDGNPATYTSEVEDATREALADMWSLGSDIEKIKYAHDYLTNKINYTHHDMDQSAYGGFVWGQTVCAGYAKGFAYMMHKMGIPCTVVVGKSTNSKGNVEAHAWNLVVLDGEYYLVDVTWDDPTGNPPDKYYYTYFNVTDDFISKNHERGQGICSDISLDLPYAQGQEYTFDNYFGGSAFGTDFDAIQGEMPDQYAGNYDDDYNDDDNDYYEYNDFPDEVGWWNAFDLEWTKDDWTLSDDGYWYIYDDNTQYTYIYFEDRDLYGLIDDAEPDVIYWYDDAEGCWTAEY